MKTLLIAHFDTQFDGNAAAEKLISMGIPREHIVLHVNESVGNSDASSSAPTTVLSEVSHRGAERGKHMLRSPEQVPEPSQLGELILMAELHEELSRDEAYALLEGAGATWIKPTHDPLPKENPAMWPPSGNATHVDIEQAIDAAKHGAFPRKPPQP